MPCKRRTSAETVGNSLRVQLDSVSDGTCSSSLTFEPKYLNQKSTAMFSGTVQNCANLWIEKPNFLLRLRC